MGLIIKNGISYGGGGGEKSALSELTDVNLTDIQQDNLLMWDDDTQAWVNKDMPAASETTLGGVKIDGETITIDEDGTIHGASSVEISKKEDNQITEETDGIYVAPTFVGTLEEIDEAIADGTLKEGDSVKATDDYEEIVGDMSKISSIGDGTLAGSISAVNTEVSELSETRVEDKGKLTITKNNKVIAVQFNGYTATNNEVIIANADERPATNIWNTLIDETGYRVLRVGISTNGTLYLRSLSSEIVNTVQYLTGQIVYEI